VCHHCVGPNFVTHLKFQEVRRKIKSGIFFQLKNTHDGLLQGNGGFSVCYDGNLQHRMTHVQT